MTSRVLQIQAALDDWYPVVVVGLLLVSLLGGWFAYTTVVAPGTTTEQRVAASWETAGEFDHQATVTENNSVYPVGTTLSNRSTYFTSVAPELDGAFRYRYETAERANLSVAIEEELVLRGETTGSGGESRELWRESRSLASRRVDSLAPGERVRVPFAVDVRAAENRTKAIQEELGTRGRTSVSILARVRVTGTVDGQQVDNTTVYRLPIDVQGSTAVVEGSGPVVAAHERTALVTVPVTHSLSRRVASIGLFAAPLGALLGLVLARWRGGVSVSAAERERLAHDRDRAEFDEWITTATLPDAVRAWPRVAVDSLQGLVDLAIDTDSRVLEDQGTYYVVHDGLVYAYAGPAAGPLDEQLRDPSEATSVKLVTEDERPNGDGPDAPDS